MYQLQGAVVLPIVQGSRWEERDISLMTVVQVSSEFKDVYLILSHPALADVIYVRFENTKAWQLNITTTITELIQDIGNSALLAEDTLPTTELAHVLYEDAFRAKYKVELAKIGFNYPPEYPAEELPDLRLTRPLYDTDLALIHYNCLVSVNGYLHMTDTDGEKLYVKDGGKTMRAANLNNIGLYSFYNIGRVTKIPLSNTFVEPMEEHGVMKDKISIVVPGVDLQDKTVLLSLGGYLVFPKNGTFWQYSEDGFALNLNALPYLERICESKNFLELSELGLHEFGFHPDAYDADQVWSDEVIFRYLTMSQSFLIIVDSSFLSYNRMTIRHNSFPGMFTAYTEPKYPLVTGYGRLAEYWKTFEDGHWAVNVNDSYLRNYVFNERTKKNLKVYTNQLNSSTPEFDSRGTMLEIMGYKRTTD